jgi:hypothetical protein
MLSVLVLALIGMAAPAFGSAWLEPPWARIGPTAAAGTAQALNIALAHNEWESAQLILRGPVTGVTITVGQTPLTVRLSLEHYVTVTRGSANWSMQTNKPLGPGQYPDALLPMPGSVTVAAGQNQPLWIDVYASKGLAPGDYCVPMIVTDANGAVTLHLMVTVWNFDLPDRSAEQTAFGTWPPNRGNAALEKLLLEHGLQPTWIGSANTAADIALGQTGASLGFWASINKGTGVIGASKPTAAMVDAALVKFPGLALSYAYLADEPIGTTGSSALQAWSGALAGRIKRMVTVPPRSPWSSWLDICVGMPQQYVATDQAAFIAHGGRVWSCMTLQQSGYAPCWQLDYPEPNYRLMAGMINWRLGYTGLLYWKVDQPATPWDNVEAYSSSHPGEAQLVYKLVDGSFAPSIRMNWLRDGVDDFDLLAMLAPRGQTDWARQTIAPVALDWHTWSRDPAAIEAVRRQLAAKLQSLAAPPH